MLSKFTKHLSFFFLAISFIPLSCILMNEDPSEAKSDTAIVEVVSRNDIFPEWQDVGEPFSWEDFISARNVSRTSGVARKSDTENFCDSSEVSGFYGFYFLIDQRLDTLAGKAYVYVPGGQKNWTETDRNQRLWSIVLWTDIITLWDKIEIGMDRTMLEEFIRENKGFSVKKGENYMQAHFNDYLCAMWFADGKKLTRIEVRKNCEQIRMVKISGDQSE